MVPSHPSRTLNTPKSIILGNVVVVIVDMKSNVKRNKTNGFRERAMCVSFSFGASTKDSNPRTILKHEGASTFDTRYIVVNVTEIDKSTTRETDTTKDRDATWQLGRDCRHATISLFQHGHVGFAVAIIPNQYPIHIRIGIVTNFIPN